MYDLENYKKTVEEDTQGVGVSNTSNGDTDRDRVADSVLLNVRGDVRSLVSVPNVKSPTNNILDTMDADQPTDEELKVFESQKQKHDEEKIAYLDKCVQQRQMIEDYVKLLFDPFNAKPVRMPGQTLVPTTLVQYKFTKEMVIGPSGQVNGFWNPAGMVLDGPSDNLISPMLFVVSRTATSPAFVHWNDAILQADANKIIVAQNEWPYIGYCQTVRLIAGGLKVFVVSSSSDLSGSLTCGSYIIPPGAGKPPRNVTTGGVSPWSYILNDEALFGLKNAKTLKAEDGLKMLWIPHDRTCQNFTKIDLQAQNAMYPTMEYSFVGTRLPPGAFIKFEFCGWYEMVPRKDLTGNLSPGLFLGGIGQEFYTMTDVSKLINTQGKDNSQLLITKYN